jgi:hypothetical protein
MSSHIYEPFESQHIILLHIAPMEVLDARVQGVHSHVVSTHRRM